MKLAKNLDRPSFIVVRQVHAVAKNRWFAILGGVCSFAKKNPPPMNGWWAEIASLIGKSSRGSSQGFDHQG